jgi:hypothetical protein
MNKQKILIGIIVLIVVLGGFCVWKIYFAAKKIEILTNKSEYQKSESLKFKINNNSENQVCLSSIYLYRLEKKNDEWKSYSYPKANREDIIEICIIPDGEKAFEINLPDRISGIHRLAIPSCVSCQEGEIFKENKTFYSNQFEVR